MLDGNKPITKSSILTSEMVRIKLEEKRAESNSLFHIGKPQDAKDVASSFLSKAIKMHLTDVVIDLACICRYYYSSIEPNRAKSRKYNQIIETHLERRRVEERIDCIYQEYALLNNISKHNKFPTELIEEVQLLVERQQNFRICLYGYYILVSYFIGSNDGKRALRYFKKAVEYFEDLPFDTRKPQEIFALTIIPLLIKNRVYVEAYQIIKAYRPKKKSYNYFRSVQLEIFLLIRMQKYDSVAEFLENFSLRGAQQIVKEEFHIIQAYVYVLAQLGLVKSGIDLKIGKFWNETIQVQSDKTGHNVNLVVLEVLIGYARRDESIVDRTPAYRRYLLRHTKKNDRRYIFLKSLIRWVESNFDYDFHEDLKKLGKTQGYSIHFEIIPYETLINILIEHRKAKKV